MGRYKDYRERPSRGYDDDRMSNDPMEHRWSPQTTPSPAGASDAVDAVVKWFNAEKGFGFVGLPNGADAFLHVRQLEAAGHSRVPDGARLKVRLGDGQKGPEVTEVLLVDATAAEQQSFVQPRRDEALDVQESVGTVRMYKTDKGFGFIGLDEGGKDACTPRHLRKAAWVYLTKVSAFE
jgi:CspA family cold shock protein